MIPLLPLNWLLQAGHFASRSPVDQLFWETQLGLQKLGGFVDFFLSFSPAWRMTVKASLFFKGGNQVPEIAEPEMAGRRWQRAGGPRATLPGRVDFGLAA